MKKFKVGDTVTCLRQTHAYFSKRNGNPEMIFKPGMVGKVMAIQPKKKLFAASWESKVSYLLIVNYDCPQTGKTQAVGLDFYNTAKADSVQ